MTAAATPSEDPARAERHRARMARKKALIDERIAQAQGQAGVLLVTCGNGKGKSSSAFGMVARALGHGLGGLGVVVRQQATTGGTDIVGMLLQKFAGIKFSTGILLADSCVVLSGLLVIGFGVGSGADREAVEGGSWLLSFYSLITIYVSSRVLAYVIDGASYDKLLFIISDRHEDLKRFIIEDLDRSATYIKAKGMYTDAPRDMIFLVVSRKEVHLVQHQIREIDPRAFVVVTDAYETFGEGFKQFPDKNEIHAE